MMQAYAIDTKYNPRPGHPSAKALGCTCPVMDNHNGAGRGGDGEKYGWYITGNCPVHNPTQMEPSDD